MNEKLYQGNMGSSIPMREPTPQESSAMKFFQQYIEAKFEFDQACTDLARARERREVAEKNLHALNQQIVQVAEVALHDPTQPQAAAQAPPTPNGLTGAYGRSY